MNNKVFIETYLERYERRESKKYMFKRKDRISRNKDNWSRENIDLKSKPRCVLFNVKIPLGL